MNKSKFLKKSLAILLALMLVFAMIPLSASAAQTDYINYLTVNGKNAAVDGDGYSVTVGTPKVTLTASLSDNVRLLYVDDQGEKKTIPATGELVDLSDGYSAGVEDEYELTVIAMAKENPDVSDEETEYTYNVTVKVSTTADSTNTALEGLADGNKTWPNMVDWSVDNEANVVNVLFKFGARHPTKATAGTEDVKLDPTDFAAKDPNATVTVVKNDEITVTAQNNSSETYKLVFTNEPAFDSFTIPKQTGETEFTYGSGNYNFIDIDVPYAYDYTNVVPTFELVEKFAGKDLVGKGADEYTFISSVTAIPYTGEIAEDPMSTEYENGKVSYWKYVFLINTGETGIGKREITLRIHPVQLNPAGDLLTVKVTDRKTNHSNTTEINGTGTNNIEMPNGSLTSGSGFSVELTFSQDATVYVYDKAGEQKVTSVDGKSATVTLDLGEGTSFNVKVVSEDGKVTKNYQINLNAASVAEAKLDSVIFKDLTTGKLYEADITEDGNEKGTVVLTVPYSWRDVSTLSNAVAYINASTGAVVNLIDPATSTWNEDWNGKTDGTPKGTSLDKIIGSATWFPFPGDEDATSTIQVTNKVGGVDGSETVTRTYTVRVKTETAKGGRTIESLNFSSEDNVKDITADNTFSAKLGSAKLDDGSATGKTVNTIEVTVPYSWPKPKSENGTMYLYQLAMDDGAKLYAHDGSTWKAETGVDALGQLTFDLAVNGKFDAVTDGEIDTDKAIPVRVLSEANSVDFSATDKKNEITEALTTGSKLYTEYYIYCVKAPAETGAELLSIESVDENVTVTLKDRVITVNVPNSYPTSPVYTTNPETFALKFTTSKQAKVYETYNKAANTVDNQLVSEKSLFGVYDQNDELYVVKATSTDATGNIKLTGDVIKDGEPAEPKVGAIYVRSEDGNTTNAYTVKLVINKVETGADVTALSVNGTAATIARDQINVRLPLGTKLYPVTLDIDASKMATVYVSPTTVADPVNSSTDYKYDPEARYDVNRPLKITVVAEDKETSKIYTLTATVADSFNDVPTSEWYYDEVMTAANAGWINGTKPGYFEPNGTMTRGDFAVIIARILGCDTEATVESKFPDCNETDYFNAAVTFCKLRGIIDGDDKGYFNPYDAITREEMAKILCNALELDELETSANPFDDDAEIAQWAKGYVNACQAEGIFEGADGYFNPRDNATRAEGAAVLVRAFA